MAKEPSVHVTPRENGWAVVREGNDRATSVHRTQAEAAREGRGIARRHETGFLLHGKDGRIREHNDYGGGRRPREGAPTGRAAGDLAPGTRASGGPTADEEGRAARRATDEQGGVAGSGTRTGDTGTGAFREHGRGPEGLRQPGSDLGGGDELRVTRSEEELRVGTREREAGRVNVRKRVRVDRERLEVPTRREEVSVERVPVDEEATGAEIGEDEISVPVVEEEVVVEKRAVAKEEVRVRKGAVEDIETVEEDVRREEVEVDDRAERRTG